MLPIWWIVRGRFRGAGRIRHFLDDARWRLPDQFRVVLLILGELAVFSAAFLLSGRFWLRGEWRRAVLSLVFAFATGLLMDGTVGRGRKGDGPTRVLLNRILMPE